MNKSLSVSKEYTNLSLWIVVGCCLGLLVANPHPYALLASLSVLLGVVLIKYHEVGFYLILLSIFFADWFKELGLIPDQMTWLPDVILLILSFKILFLRDNGRKTGRIPATVPIILFILWGLISTLLNPGHHIVTTILGFRQDLRYALMFFLLVGFGMEERFFRNMSRLLIVILLVQVPVALAKLTVYGQGEQAIGTYAAKGGTYSTILPLVAISIFLGFFFFERPRARYIVGCLLFVLFSIVGGKRGFAFFGALLSVFLFWQAGRKNFARMAFLAPFVIGSLAACVYFVPSLNPAFKDIRHLIEFPLSYTTSYTRDTGEAGGRAAAMEVTFNTLRKDYKNLLFGFGPGSMSESYFKEFTGKLADKVPLFYGKSQWVIMSFEYGFVGTFLFMSIFVPLFIANQKFFKATKDAYWKAMAFGNKGIWLTYLMGFFYGRVFRTDVLAFIFWFFAAAVCSVGREEEIP